LVDFGDVYGRIYTSLLIDPRSISRSVLIGLDRFIYGSLSIGLSRGVSRSLLIGDVSFSVESVIRHIKKDPYIHLFKPVKRDPNTYL